MARLHVQRLAPYGLVAGLLLSGGALTACGAAASAAGDSGASTSTASAASSSAETVAATQTAATRGGAAQRQAAFRADIRAALDGLVKQGTLNATQEQAVASALEQRPSGTFSRSSVTASRTAATARGGRGAGQRPGGQQAFEKRALDPLVQQGTITANQETAVLQAVQQTMAAHRPAGTPTPQGGNG